MITLADIREARERVGPVLRPTPVEPSDSLTAIAGRPVLLKPEFRLRSWQGGLYDRTDEEYTASVGWHF